MARSDKQRLGGNIVNKTRCKCCLKEIDYRNDETIVYRRLNNNNQEWYEWEPYCNDECLKRYEREPEQWISSLNKEGKMLDDGDLVFLRHLLGHCINVYSTSYKEDVKTKRLIRKIDMLLNRR